MKLKKLAAVLAATAIMAVSATAETIPDQDFAGFWSAHTPGIELSEDETTITFHTKSSGTNNWDTSVFVLYNGDEGVVNGAGYAEVAVFRLDSWGWNAAGDTSPEKYQALLDAGITFTPVNEGLDWNNFLSDIQAGVDVTLVATSTSLHVTSSNGIDYTATFPATKYLSLSGENASLSKIEYTVKSESSETTPSGTDETPSETTPSGTDETPSSSTTDTQPHTGDATNVAILSVIGLAAVAGLVVASKKKEA